MPGMDVRFTTRDGETFDGYLTGPNGAAKAPGILLITALFGTDQEMRDLADAWADDGFLVSVPDIFWRGSRLGLVALSSPEHRDPQEWRHLNRAHCPAA